MSWVVNSYKQHLGRDGSNDPDGIAWWENEVNSGRHTAETADKAIYNSPEAQTYRFNSGAKRATEQQGVSPLTSLTGADIESQVRNLYHQNLGRAADQGGLDFWMKEAADKGMESVTSSFLSNPEVQGYASRSQGSATGNTGNTGNRGTATAPVNSVAVARAAIPATETVEGRLEGLLNPNNPLMKQAKTRGLEYANGRGLLNSSIAGEAVQGEMMKSALPIAQQDASTYFKQGTLDQGFANQFNLSDRQYLQTEGSNDAQRDFNWRSLQANKTSEFEIETLRQQAGLWAQYTVGVSNINSSDLTQAEKDLAVQSLFDQFNKVNGISNSIRGMTINPDGTVSRAEQPAPTGTTSNNAASQPRISTVFGDGGIYASGYTKGSDGSLVDSDGKRSPPRVEPTATSEGLEYVLVDGRWKEKPIPKSAYTSDIGYR